MDKMMNRYITALLVVLTATGLEAQAYQSALKAARGGDVALEELCRHSAFQGKEAEILSFIRAIKSVEQRDDQEPAMPRGWPRWIAKVRQAAWPVDCRWQTETRRPDCRPPSPPPFRFAPPVSDSFFPSCSATGRCSSHRE